MPIYFDAYTMGANDCRARRARCEGLPYLDQQSYDAVWRNAFRLACQRLDVAELFPDHFGG